VTGDTETTMELCAKRSAKSPTPSRVDIGEVRMHLVEEKVGR
jgi:hypothetical protein